MNNVFWITGLSAAGKTTLAVLLTDYLRSLGKCVVMLDGDELRNALGSNALFERKDRLNLAYQYSHLARIISKQGVNVVVSTVALFKEIHIWNRKNLPGYFEVYLKVQLEELKKRDPKGIYHRFEIGEISNVAGLDIPVDEPLTPDTVIEYTPGLNPEKELIKLLSVYKKKFPESH